MFFSTVLSCNIVHKVRKNGTKIFLNPKAFYLRTLAALQYSLRVAMRGQYSMSIWTWQAIVLKYMYYSSPLHKRWPAGHNSLILCRLGSISPAKVGSAQELPHIYLWKSFFTMRNHARKDKSDFHDANKPS